MKDLNKKALIIIAAIAVLLLVFIILFAQSRVAMSEMTEVFTEEKQILINDFQNLYLDYDSLRSNNEEINQKLDIERERIAQLQDELKTVRATNARRIKELQNELNTMRNVMVSFVHQLDSLNQLNIKLTDENGNLRNQINRQQKSYNELAKQNETLANKIDEASRLETSNVAAVGLNYKDKKVSSADRVNKIKIDFTVLRNPAASVGMLTIYARITRPDGELLLHSKSDVFAFEDTQLNYSAKRNVEYSGEDVSAYIVYDVDAGELMEGTYEIEIFCAGNVIGRTTFKLS
ncbi:MAG: hypothetical protein E7069_00900 [Bacteroidales bacterium]|jgi:uncharacterized protein YlxW (UPF0749 family)|nr:hypothetical protein [Bacteroidales bacterium]